MSNWPDSVALPRSISFQKLLDKILRGLRIDPVTGPSDLAVLGFILECVNAATRYAWTQYPWPESKVFQECAVHGHPATSTPFIPRTYLLTSVATLYGAWDKHPLADPDNACEVRLQQGPDGWYVSPAYSGATAWLYYRPDAPEYETTKYNATQAYAAGDRVLYSDGHCYLMIGGTPVTGTAPADGSGTVDANWQRLVVLYVLSEMIKAGAIALYFRTEEKFTSEQTLSTAMGVLIEDEILRIDNQDGDTRTVLYHHH